MTPTEKRRILYVITKAVWGGSQRYVYDLALAAKASGHEVALAYGQPGLLSEKLEANGIACAKVPGLARDLSFFSEVKAFKEFIRLLRLSRPDVVHANGSKAGLAILAARIAGVPRILFTSHGWAFNETRPLWQKVFFWFSYAATIYLSHKTICVSEAVRNNMRSLPFSKGRFLVIRNGIGVPPFKTKAESRATLASELNAKTWIGVIAELHPSKRVEDAIEAFAILKENHSDLALVVIGEGEERARLESHIEKRGVAKDVRLAGFVDNASQYLRAFDICVLPSRTEALAYVLLEAGHAGLPVVATRVGGIPEIVLHKKTGLLVPPAQPAVLARAILTLLEDSELAGELGRSLKGHVEQDFGVSRMTSETLALYER